MSEQDNDKPVFERGHSYSYVNSNGDRVIVNETRTKKDVMTLDGDWNDELEVK